nr:uncharacterized protein LOC129019505 [Pongo pygmaeus]XP_054318138.1 uncharacterized protein LOC129019505 [Pongo pygmaeus]XP_054318139.1 uncharacterized protein LOC129019505 [Pongo pygmaeus]
MTGLSHTATWSLAMLSLSHSLVSRYVVSHTHTNTPWSHTLVSLCLSDTHTTASHTDGSFTQNTHFSHSLVSLSHINTPQSHTLFLQSSLAYMVILLSLAHTPTDRPFIHTGTRPSLTLTGLSHSIQPISLSQTNTSWSHALDTWSVTHLHTHTPRNLSLSFTRSLSNAGTSLSLSHSLVSHTGPSRSVTHEYTLVSHSGLSVIHTHTHTETAPSHGASHADRSFTHRHTPISPTAHSSGPAAPSRPERPAAPSRGLRPADSSTRAALASGKCSRPGDRRRGWAFATRVGAARLACPSSPSPRARSPKPPKTNPRPRLAPRRSHPKDSVSRRWNPHRAGASLSPGVGQEGQRQGVA